jgi:hypothetical protein
MMKPVTPRSSSIGTPDPRAMRELLDFLWQARQLLAERKAQTELKSQDQAKSIATVVKN